MGMRLSFARTVCHPRGHVGLDKAWLKAPAKGQPAIPSFSFLKHITCDTITESRIQLEIIEIMKIAIFSVLAFIALALAVVPPQKAVIISTICPEPFVLYSMAFHGVLLAGYSEKDCIQAKYSRELLELWLTVFDLCPGY
jgi:hypothetical protein